MHIHKLYTCLSQANFGQIFLSSIVHVHVEIHVILLLIIMNGMAFNVNALMVTKSVHCMHNEWLRYMLVVNFNTKTQNKVGLVGLNLLSLAIYACHKAKITDTFVTAKTLYVNNGFPLFTKAEFAWHVTCTLRPVGGTPKTRTSSTTRASPPSPFC